MQKPKIIHLIKSRAVKEGGLAQLSDDTGVSRSALWALSTGRRGKFRKQTLDSLYDFFELQPDEFYDENMKKWHKPDFSVIGNILRCMRKKKGWSVQEVAKMIKGTDREIMRIEAGDHLPSYRSWYMTTLLELYEVPPEEQEMIRWGVTILKDLMQINNRLDPIESVDNMTLKKTVVQI